MCVKSTKHESFVYSPINNKIEKVRVYSKVGDIGIITYNSAKEKFTFEYADDFKGYPFGDINVTESRIHIKNSLFTMFRYDSCYSREKAVKALDIKDPESNQAQWFFLKFWEQMGTSTKGFCFEQIQ